MEGKQLEFPGIEAGVPVSEQQRYAGVEDEFRVTSANGRPIYVDELFSKSQRFFFDEFGHVPIFEPVLDAELAGGRIWAWHGGTFYHDYDAIGPLVEATTPLTPLSRGIKGLVDNVLAHRAQLVDLALQIAIVAQQVAAVVDPVAPRVLGEHQRAAHVDGLDELVELGVVHRLREPLRLLEQAVEQVGEDGFKKAPVGAGPYRFVSFKPGVELVLEAFEGYWRKPPSVKTLVFRVIPDESTRLAALKRGEVDIATGLPPSMAGDLAKDHPNLGDLYMWWKRHPSTDAGGASGSSWVTGYLWNCGQYSRPRVDSCQAISPCIL